MNDSNPYDAPESPLGDLPASVPPGIEQVADGQKMIIYAILIVIVAIILQLAINPYLGLISYIGSILAIVGVVRVATGMGIGTGMKVVLIILMLIPCVSLITLLILNQKATAILRAAGYKVGLLGASK